MPSKYYVLTIDEDSEYSKFSDRIDSNVFDCIKASLTDDSKIVVVDDHGFWCDAEEFFLTNDVKEFTV